MVPELRSLYPGAMMARREADMLLRRVERYTQLRRLHAPVLLVATERALVFRALDDATTDEIFAVIESICLTRGKAS